MRYGLKGLQMVKQAYSTNNVVGTFATIGALYRALADAAANASINNNVMTGTSLGSRVRGGRFDKVRSNPGDAGYGNPHGEAGGGKHVQRE